MKSKISRILGVGLVLAVVASLLVTSIPASAGTLKFNAESTLTAGLQLFPYSDVGSLALAADGKTAYATLVGSGIQYTLLKTTNAGGMWLRNADNGTAPSHQLPVNNLPNTVTAIKKVAVAPDVADGSVVAIYVDSTAYGKAIYYSADGGATWSDLNPVTDLTMGLTLASVNAIAISPAVAGVRTIAVAGTDGSGAALFLFDLGGVVGRWVDATSNNAVNYWNIDNFGDATQVDAVAFSPNFISDRTILAVTNNATGVKLQLANTVSKAWNQSVYQGTWNKGVVIVPTTTTTFGGTVDAASLSMPSTYLGQDPSSHVVFVALATDGGTSGGLFRMNDNIVTTLQTGVYMSVAYDTSGGKLVAGDYNDNNVWRSDNPLATPPTLTPANFYNRPGIDVVTTTTNPTKKVMVYYWGANVVAGTSGDESCFSVSTNGGQSFVDISLIDTSLNLKDSYVAADGSKLYLTSTSSSSGWSYVSIWRKVTSLQRVLCINAPSTDFLVRAAPENADAVYVVSTGTDKQVFYSADGGTVLWNLRYALEQANDVAVESASVIYLLSGTKVSKSIDTGYLWDNPLTPTGLGSAADIVSLGTDQLLAADTAGGVAYSTNGNVSWTKISASVPSSSGGLRVAADKLTSGGNIYAVDTSANPNIYRYTIGTSTSWTAMRDTGIGAGFTARDIALASGVLYAVADNTTDTELVRTLIPATAADDVDWSIISPVVDDILGTTSFVVDRCPDALWVSVGADKNPKLWVVATAVYPSVYPDGYSTISTATKFESFVDTLALTGPAVTSPADKTTVNINAQTGMAMDVAFTWGQPSTATKYQLQISLDSNFTQIIDTENVGPTTVTPVVQMVGPNTGNRVVYQPSTTYYWRVRVAQDGPVYSPYSAVRSFKIAPLTVFAIVSPEKGAYDVPVLPTFVWTPVEGATSYELVVSEDPTFAIIDFSRTSNQTYFQTDEQLAYSTTYYWRVRPAGGVVGGVPVPYVYGVFTTEAKPTTPAPPVTVVPPPPTSIQVITVPTTPAIPSYLLWIIIGIGAVLVIALIVLIVRTRRVV
jgi:hypothetical protein